MAVAIKVWAKIRDIADPANRTLSSYSYVILLISFLQH
jgi:terminal uridylyltransferase